MARFDLRSMLLRGLGVSKQKARSVSPSAPKIPLRQALIEAQRDAGRAPAFFRSLLEDPVCAIVRRHEGQWELVSYADAEGEPFIPMFSERANVPGDLPEDGSMLLMKGRDVLTLARGRGRVVLDPGEPHFKAFSAEDVARILDRLVERR